MPLTVSGIFFAVSKFKHSCRSQQSALRCVENPDKPNQVNHQVMKHETKRNSEQLAQQFTELASAYLWQMVIDENQPEPDWLTDPAWQSEALQRVVASGVDKHDLTDLLREIQVQMIANFAQFLDYPQQLQSLSSDCDAEFEFVLHGAQQSRWPVAGVYAALMRADPGQRYGESRSLIWRRWQQLPGDIQVELGKLCQQQRYAPAAQLWQAYYPAGLAACLLELKQLANELKLRA